MGLSPDTNLGRYRIRSLLSVGGMGEVYLADDLALRRSAAIKVLPSDFALNADRLRRFEREALAISKLNHPNILTIYDIGTEGSTNFMATEFIEGESLRNLVSRGPVPMKEALQIAIQATSALSAAHAAGIIHRDIKPENIMLRRDGLVKVLDFGLAKWSGPISVPEDGRTLTVNDTHPGLVIGTARYMSPEQARGLEIDPRTDIFSLGAVIYELLSGRAAFDGPTTSDIIAAILKTDPPLLTALPPETAVAAQRIVTKAICKDKDLRYQSMKDLELDLRALNQQLEVRASAQPIPSAAPPARMAGKRPTRIALGIATILLISAAATLAYVYFWKPSPIKSLAILPFANATGDPSLEYLSDGITETLIDNVSELPQLKVIARNSVFRYKGKEVDPQSVGKSLGAQAILTGDVARRGQTLQINADLVDARENAEIWGGHYNRPSTDVQAVEEEIAATISEKLRLRLSNIQQQQLAKRPTQNGRAYDLYLTGLFYGTNGGWSGNKKAVEYFEQAIALDPKFVPAWANESISYLNLAVAVTPDLSSAEAISKAKVAAETAIAADPSSWAGHVALATVYTHQWNWSLADREYRRAIELNPNAASAHSNYSGLLADLNRHTEALEEQRRGEELDPLSVDLRMHRGFILMLARQFDDAVAHLRQMLQAHPESTFGHEYLALSYGGQGHYAEAIAEYQKFISLDRPYPFIQALMAHAYASSGKRDQALAIVRSLSNSKASVSPAALATAYLALGDKKSAFDSLERAWTEHDNQLQYINSVWLFDPIRSDPRFQNLLRRMRFVPR